MTITTFLAGGLLVAYVILVFAYLGWWARSGTPDYQRHAVTVIGGLSGLLGVVLGFYFQQPRVESAEEDAETAAEIAQDALTNAAALEASAEAVLDTIRGLRTALTSGSVAGDSADRLVGGVEATLGEAIRDSERFRLNLPVPTSRRSRADP